MGNLSHSNGASPAIWDHTMLPATWHRWTHPALTQPRRPMLNLPTPGGMEGWVEMRGWLHTKMVYLSAESHPSN